MDLARLSSAIELQQVVHPHFGRIQKPGYLKSAIGILTGRNRKAVSLEDYSSGARQTVALQVDPRNFMVTIGNSFVLVTLSEGASRHPIIQKPWTRVGHEVGTGLLEFTGTVSRYVDADGLKWEHRFNRPDEEDELIAFGSADQEILLIVLETLR